MTRLDRIIKAFNDYDNFVQRNTIIGIFEAKGLDYTTLNEYAELNSIRNEVSILIGELKRHGCRREN